MSSISIIPSSIFVYQKGSIKGDKTALFDLDDTIVKKNNIPIKGMLDKLLSLEREGYDIVILSNQKKRSIGDIKLKERFEKLKDIIPTSFIAFCAREDDEYRKPDIKMISLFSRYKIQNPTFYVGDSAGRKGDYSDCDKEFAKNASLEFYTPEEYSLL